MILRQLTENDWPGVMEVERQCFPRAERWSKKEYQKALEAGELVCLVAIAFSNRVAGCIWLEVKDEGVGVFSLGVLPDYRKRAIAAALLGNALFGLIENVIGKPVKLQVHVDNIPAQRLYYRFGFKPARFLKNYYARNKHGLEMER